MTTAATYAKANRYLLENRVRIALQEPSTTTAYAIGDHGTYLIVGDDDGWLCTCPAKQTCAHIIATEALCMEQLHHDQYGLEDNQPWMFPD